MVDLIVVGAGSMGGWTAFWANRAGLETVLLDAFGPGDARATSGDESRIIRSAHGADDLYARWSREARELWLRFGEEWGEPLFVPAGTLWLARREGAIEATSEATLRGLGIPVEHVLPEELARRWPQLDPAGLAFALYEPEAGLVRARRSTMVVAEQLAREGGRVEVAAVRPGRVDGDRLLDVVAADGARRAADQFVFACGPWLPRLFPDVIGPLIRVTKQDVVFLGPPAGDSSYGADRLPPWVELDSAIYALPALDGRGVKLGPDRAGAPFDPSAGERIVDADSVRLVRDYVRRRVPGLAAAAVVETRVCQYEFTLDGHFVIDRHPAWSNVWLVGGGSGHGFKHGPRLGQYVLARLLGAAPGPGEERFGLARAAAAPAGVRTGNGAIPDDSAPY